MSQLNKLTELFMKFPGIGSRQARRFAYFIISSDTGFAAELSATIKKIKAGASRCRECSGFYEVSESPDGGGICAICSDTAVDKTLLMVVGREIDLENVVRSRLYHGRYYVLGGRFSPAGKKELSEHLSLKDLCSRIESNASELREVICAFSANPEGDLITAEIKQKLAPLAEKHFFVVTTLGKGFSTGTELQYSDAETLKNALQNRR